MTYGEALEFRRSVRIRESHLASEHVSFDLTTGPEVPDAGRAGLLSGLRRLDVHPHRSRQSPAGDFAVAAKRLADVYDRARLPQPEEANHQRAARFLRRSRTDAARSRIPAAASARRQAASVVAFERNGIRSRVIVAVPRLMTR